MEPSGGSCKPSFISVSSDAIRHATQNTRQERDGGRQQLLSFPVTRSILWDRRPLDSPTLLHINQHRNPSLIVEEKTLRLAHRFAQDSSTDTYTCYLLASLSVNPDGEGISVNVDRFEVASKSAEENGHSAYNIVIPCLVKKNSAKPKISSQDFGNSIKAIHHRCRNKARINLGEFISMYAYCSYHENQQSFIFHVDFTLVTSGVKFKLTPVNTVPVVPTALSKNLAGPLSMSGVQGEPKSGYLTMDQTRKLLLVLESDPKVPSLPLVGIWISGVSNPHDPFIWACCLRYLFNPTLEERVIVPPEAFLVVLYTPIHSKAEFYECITLNGSVSMKLDLNTGHEVIQMPKDCLGRAQSPLEVELLNVEAGEKKELFEAALENNRLILEGEGSNGTEGRKSNFPEDITPRSLPAPHFTRVPVIQPSVPEVSLLLDENDGNFAPRQAPQPLRMTHAPMYSHPVLNGNTKSSNKPKKTSRNQEKVKTLHTQSSSQPNSPVVNGWPSGLKSSSVPNSPDVLMTQHYNTPGEGLYHQPAYAGPVMQQQPYFGHGQYPHHLGIGPYPPQYGSKIGQPFINQTLNAVTSSNLHGSYGHNITYPQLYNGGQTAVVQSRPLYPQQIPPNNIYNPQGPNSLPWNGNGYSEQMMGNMVVQGQFVAPQGAGYKPNVDIYGQQMQRNLGQMVNRNQIAPSNLGNMQGYQQSNQQLGKNGQQEKPSNSISQSINTSAMQNDPCPNPHKTGLCPTKSSDSRKSQEEIDHEQTRVKQISLSPINRNRSNPVSADNSPHHESGSTDSGLHVSDTPDPDGLLNNTIDSVKTSASSAVRQQQVPPDVYELLKMQDNQLKMLREQLAQLLAKQNEGNNSTIQPLANGALNDPTNMAPPPSLQSTRDMATQSSNHATPMKIKSHVSANSSMHDNTSSRGPINTSMMYQEPELVRREAVSTNSSLNLTVQDISIHAGSLEHMKTSSGSSFKTTRKMTDACAETDGNFSTDTISFGELQLTGIQDRTEESMMSEMIVDMPAYGSISPEKRSSSGCTEDGNRSPLLGESVSMYERNFADAEDNTASTGLGDGQPQVSLLYRNHKQFYQNLMGNVQKFLSKSNETSPPISNNNTHEYVPNEDQSLPVGLRRSHSVPESMKENAELNDTLHEQRDDIGFQTLKQLQAMGIELNKLSSEEKSRIDQTLCLLDPVMLPKISYVSMMLDGDSDVNAEADALAMKYLTDEQLTELAKLRLSSPAKSKYNKGLDGLLHNTTCGSPNGKSNVTLYGFPSNHMSFASKKYLERYGLLDSSTSEIEKSKISSSEDDTLQGTSSMKNDTLNVKEFLQKLSEKSFTEESTSNRRENSAEGNLRHSYPSSCSEHSDHRQQSDKLHADVSNSFHVQGKPMSTPMDWQNQRKADCQDIDLTLECTPSQKPEHTRENQEYTPAYQFHDKRFAMNGHNAYQSSDVNNPNVYPSNNTKNTAIPVPQLPTTTNFNQLRNMQELNKLPQVFEKTPVRNTKPRQAAYTDQGVPGVRNGNSLTRQMGPKSMDNVLDIERLRELPKLL